MGNAPNCVEWDTSVIIIIAINILPNYSCNINISIELAVTIKIKAGYRSVQLPRFNF